MGLIRSLCSDYHLIQERDIYTREIHSNETTIYPCSEHKCLALGNPP